jgi:hypothetical protein
MHRAQQHGLWPSLDLKNGRHHAAGMAKDIFFKQFFKRMFEKLQVHGHFSWRMASLFLNF